MEDVSQNQKSKPMVNKLSKRNYKCNCGAKLEEFVWENELSNYTFGCTSCAKSVGFSNIVVKKVRQTTSIRTPTKNR